MFSLLPDPGVVQMLSLLARGGGIKGGCYTPTEPATVRPLQLTYIVYPN
jgi:hypothetical protein